MPSTDDQDGPNRTTLASAITTTVASITAVVTVLTAVVTDPAALRRDARVRAALLGCLVGATTVPVLVLVQGWLPRTASNTAFAFGALVLGFAVLSWSGAVLLGPAIEYLQEYMDLASGWTEAGARRAFAILSALGVGVMAGSTLGTLLVDAL